MSQSFLEPYYDPNDSGKTPAQQAGDSLAGSGGVMSAKDTALLRGIKMAGGAVKRTRRISRKKQLGGGRTLNIPYPVPGRPDLIPGPTANNAWYVGEPCVGAHCGVNVVPSASWMINKGLTIGNDVVPGSTTMYPVVDRLGNSYAEVLPGVQDYTGTPLNSGPFEIKCVSGGRISRKKNQSRKNGSKLNNKRKLGGSPPAACNHQSTMVSCYQGLAYIECRDCHRYWRSRANDHLCDEGGSISRKNGSKLNNKRKLGGSPPAACNHKSTMISCYQGLAYIECRDCHRYWRSRANDHLCDD